MVKKEFKHLLMDVKLVSDKICKLRIFPYRKITIINVHAPTENINEDEKDLFYEELYIFLMKFRTMIVK